MTIAKKLMGAAAVVMLIASAATAADRPKTVSGTWTMKAEGYVLKLVLVQQGTKLSGELHGPHGPMPLTGTFAKGKIAFSGAGADGIGGKLEFSATGVLQKDGTFAGDFTSETSGHLKWTAVRESTQ